MSCTNALPIWKRFPMANDRATEQLRLRRGAHEDGAVDYGLRL